MIPIEDMLQQLRFRPLPDAVIGKEDDGRVRIAVDASAEPRKFYCLERHFVLPVGLSRQFRHNRERNTLVVTVDRKSFLLDRGLTPVEQQTLRPYGIEIRRCSESVPDPEREI